MSLKMTMQSQVKMIMKAIFAKYDSDKNGYLDEKQVRDLIAQSMGYRTCNQIPEEKQKIDQFYKKVDANGDGKISKTEIELILMKILQFNSAPY